MAVRETPFHGIINVYKEEGFTSFDVVAKMRGICGQKKIGHTGTLDPDATGVLPVCLGNATKVCELLTDHEKEYVAELLLGIETDTQDTSGSVIASKGRAQAIGLSEETIRAAVESFLGTYAQVPPMYSALKVNGQKLCDLARKGIQVERTARLVEIKELEILSVKPCDLSVSGQMRIQSRKQTEDSACTSSGTVSSYGEAKEGKVTAEIQGLPVVTLRVLCSKGTYIRTLCSDIGEKLGCGGCMLSLKRSKVGPFTLDNAVSLSELQRRKEENTLNEVLLGVDSLFRHYPGFCVKEAFEKQLQNGNKLLPHQVERRTPDLGDIETLREGERAGQKVRIYHCSGEFAGIYEWKDGEELYAPVKMFL